MMHVLIALVDVGSSVQLEEALVQAGIGAKWDSAQAEGPRGDAGCDVVVLDADHLGKRLATITARWREHPSLPGVIAIGASQAARDQAPHARITLLAPGASPATIASAIREAAKLRLASGMRWPVLRAALALPPAANEPAEWQPTLVAARNVDLEIARAALRWHAQHYATPTELLDQLRAERILTVPELETLAHVDGTLTVQRLVKVGPLDPLQTARVLWALASMGAIELTPEVRDTTTYARRALDEIRAHLRAREQRLDRATYYDVLELTPLAEYPEIEAAYELVAARYSPQALARFDLGELSARIESTWAQIEKARSVLVDHASRGRYHDWLRQKLSELRTSWAIEPAAVKLAAEAFVRGQRALAEGDVHRAMGDLAMACRHHGGHPEYEAHLAWARLRVQVASGRDQREAAAAERRNVENILLGCRPWPKALVALALLCASQGDADSARWHLHVALTLDPNVAHGSQLAQRLGLRR